MSARSLLTPFDSTSNAMEAPVALVLVAVLSVLAFQGWALWQGQVFDVSGLGIALASAMGGGGAVGYGVGYMTRSRGMLGGSMAVDDPDGGA